MEIVLMFDERGLGCFSAVVQESRDFWDYVEPEVVEVIEAEFVAAYQEAVTAIICRL